MVALKDDNAVQILKRDRITIYVLDIAKNFEKTEAWCASNSRDQYYKNNAKDLGEMLFW